MITDHNKYESWLNKLKSELKSSDLSKYDFLWEDKRISPFEEKKNLKALKLPRSQEGWKIGIESKSDHRSIMRSLELGAECISLNLNDTQTKWNQVLKDVHVDWITWQLNGSDKAPLTHFFSNIKAPKHLNSALFFPSTLQKDLHKQYRTNPTYKSLSIEWSFEEDSNIIAQKLNRLFKDIISLTIEFKSEEVLKAVVLRYISGNDLVITISMLRAIRWVWMHFLKSCDLSADFVPIEVHTHVRNVYSEESDNMIRSTFNAFAAVTGGTDVLFIASPYTENEDTGWNLKAQHILREESLLHKHADPLSGSYTIERITEVIAEKIWSRIDVNIDKSDLRKK